VFQLLKHDLTLLDDQAETTPSKATARLPTTSYQTCPSPKPS
jgi:hypothetical protein